MLYDDRTLYLGVRCPDSDAAAPVNRPLGRRDNAPFSDNVAVYPRLQPRPAHRLRTSSSTPPACSPTGSSSATTRRTATGTRSGTARHRRGAGWSAEFLVPLSVLRFSARRRADLGDRGEAVVARTREELVSIPLKRSDRGIVARLADLDRLNGLKPVQEFSVAPYLATRFHRPSSGDDTAAATLPPLRATWASTSGLPGPRALAPGHRQPGLRAGRGRHHPAEPHHLRALPPGEAPLLHPGDRPLPGGPARQPVVAPAALLLAPHRARRPHLRRGQADRSAKRRPSRSACSTPWWPAPPPRLPATPGLYWSPWPAALRRPGRLATPRWPRRAATSWPRPRAGSPRPPTPPWAPRHQRPRPSTGTAPPPRRHCSDGPPGPLRRGPGERRGAELEPARGARRLVRARPADRLAAAGRAAQRVLADGTVLSRGDLGGGGFASAGIEAGEPWRFDVHLRVRGAPARPQRARLPAHPERAGGPGRAPLRPAQRRRPLPRVGRHLGGDPRWTTDGLWRTRGNGVFLAVEGQLRSLRPAGGATSDRTPRRDDVREIRGRPAWPSGRAAAGWSAWLAFGPRPVGLGRGERLEAPARPAPARRCRPPS